METILNIGIAQLAFASLLVLTKKPRHSSDLVLGIWLILMACFMTLTLIKNFYPSLGLEMQVFAFAFTIGPFLHMYVRCLTRDRASLDWKDLLHLAPFVLFLIVSNAFGNAVDEDFWKGNPFNTNSLVYSVAAIFSFGIYFYLAFQGVQQHQKNILDLFSYESETISLNWLKTVSISLTATLVLTVVAVMLNIVQETPRLDPGVILFLGFTIFAFGVSYYGIRQKEIYKSEAPNTHPQIAVQLDAEEIKKQEKYARSSLDEVSAQQYVTSLIEFMEKEQPYLNGDLTIHSVAEELSIPRHHLTQAINERLDKNFYTVVNEYRVEEVKGRLLSGKYDHLTLLSIALDSGFNSKSSFNMIFKKHTGLTPSEFKSQFDA